MSAPAPALPQPVGTVGARQVVRMLLVLVLAGFRRFTAYRLAAVAGIVANVTFGYIRGAVLLAIVGGGSVAAAGYTGQSLMTYNWLTQSAIGALAIWGTTEVSDRVRTGDIAVDLARPLDLMTTFLAQDLGRALASIVLRGLPTVAVGALTVGIVLPGHLAPWIAGLLGIALALVISFLARFVMQLSSFWVIEIRGIQTFYMVVSGFFAGLVFPLALMPDWLRAMAMLTPFPSMLQHPIDILSGRVTGPDIWWLVAQQVGWLVALVLLGRVLLAAGTRRLVVQGG
ncbi:ABC transporter permease [Mobilicoccus caccae]|uniref:ABC transporter permease n=1 Tax=Mobilicoccus caccae TaxID=1859295 RepID=A0ABQ6INZ2_9MICO|nr:ABC-2 family transporter protein [Mobilicoccus caccae]GMA38418.1 ABC transporter permease [Mobilicoccus caccae]